MTKNSYSTSKTIVKAFRLLEFLSEHQPSRVSQLTEGLGLTQSNLYRILDTLQDLGYVTKISKATYRLSMKVFVLGSSALGYDELPIVSQAFMARLSEISQETISLAVLYDGAVLYIDKIKSPHYLQLDQPIGKSHPLHCTALGKSLLCGLSDDKLRNQLNLLELAKYTQNTVTDVESLVEIIREAREKGYTTDFEELSIGINCIACPIRDHSGRGIAAIGVSGPTVRFGKEKMQELKPELINIAGEISMKMGYKIKA